MKPQQDGVSETPEPIRVVLESRLLPDRQVFSIYPEASVAELLETILQYLLHSSAAEEAGAMLEYYQPELSLLNPRGSQTLAPSQRLEEAGVTDGAICRIDAIPRKERQLFCQWC